MVTTLFRAWTRRARLYLATRRVLRLYRDIRRLVDALALRADCPEHVREFRTKVVGLRDAKLIGEVASGKLNRISTLTRKAAVGELTAGQVLDLLPSVESWRLALIEIERRTRGLVNCEVISNAQSLDLHPVCGTVKGGAA